MSNLQIKGLQHLIHLTGNQLKDFVIEKTILLELTNGTLIEACGFQDAINQIECLVN